MAMRRPTMRLKSADLPTFGRPTMAISPAMNQPWCSSLPHESQNVLDLCVSRRFYPGVMPNRRMIGWWSLLFLLCLGGTAKAATAFTFGATVSANLAAVGDTLLYKIVVTNTTQFVTPEIVVMSTLPATLTFIGATNSQGTVTTNGSSVTFTNTAVTFGLAATNTFSVRIATNALGTIITSVTVSGSAESETTNLTTTVTAAPRAFLRGTIKVDPGQL